MVLSKLLGGGKPTKASDKPQSEEEAFALYPPRSPSGLNPLDFGDFAKRIEGFRKAHIALKDHRQKGCLQIVELERVRFRFGRRWPAVQEKAFQIIESTLHKRLGADDLYVLSGESEIYVLTTGLSRTDAETRGLLVASDITSRLCGTVPGGTALRVKTMPFDFALGLEGVTSFQQLVKRVEAYGRSIDGAELKLFHDNVGRLRLRFRPTIDLSEQTIAAYQGEVFVEEDDHSLLPVDVLCPSSINGVFDAEVDKWALEQAAGHLDGMQDRSSAPMVSVPLHYETIAAMRFRDGYIETCKRLPESSGDFLHLEAVGIPASMPQARVRELMAYVKPFCAEIVARLADNAVSTEHLESCGIGLVSLDLGSVDPEDEKTLATLRRLAELTAANAMKSMLVNAWSVSLSHVAYKAGIDFLNGDAFAPSVDKPGSVIRLKTS